MKKYLNRIHYSEGIDFLDKLIKWFLAIFSILYGLGTISRNILYRLNILKSKKLPAYVISVGNLTTGGTGKTPITVEIANFIKNNLEINTAILSRGYGGQLSDKMANLISDGENIYATPYLAGDEPYWIATQAIGIPVITGKSRIMTGQFAIDNFDSRVLILDDGYQHIKVKRNLNILVIDFKKKFGNGWLLPAGPLREPINEIKRADKVIIVNKRPFDVKSDSYCKDFAEYIEEKFKKPTYFCKFEMAGIFNIKTSQKLEISHNKIVAFTGIGQPEFFFSYLKNKKMDLTFSQEFTDHHQYSKSEIKQIIKKAKKLKAEAIITTEKDAVKLLSFIDELDLTVPIFALKLKTNIDLENLLGDLIKTNEKDTCSQI